MFRRLRAAAPVKKTMILSWSHIELMWKIFTVTGQKATGMINLENSETKRQLIWDD